MPLSQLIIPERDVTAMARRVTGMPEIDSDEAVDQLEDAADHLEYLPAQERMAWAIENLPGAHVLSSSFGIQSAVMLHMASEIQRDLPVVLIDTGYLFPETYQFVDELVERLSLNLVVFRPEMSSEQQEARFGQLWEQGVEGIAKYNQMNKVEPMKRAFAELKVETWFSGVRRSQSASRADLPVIVDKHGSFKVHPIIDWDNRDVHRYLTKHQLPYHPLWDEGYVSVGDVHTSRPLQPGMLEEETRFFGLQRECGLHG